MKRLMAVDEAEEVCGCSLNTPLGIKREAIYICVHVYSMCVFIL